MVDGFDKHWELGDEEYQRLVDENQDSYELFLFDEELMEECDEDFDDDLKTTDFESGTWDEYDVYEIYNRLEQADSYWLEMSYYIK